MNEIENSADENRSQPAQPSPLLRRRRGVFSFLFDALHESRRRQAARVIHLHRHLIESHASRPVGWNAGNTVSGQAAARETIQPVHAAPALARSSLSGRLAVKFLIALVILGFGILHLVGGTLLDRNAATHHVQNAAIAPRGD